MPVHADSHRESETKCVASAETDVSAMLAKSLPMLAKSLPNVIKVTTNVTNVTTHRYPKASAQAVRCRCPHMSPLRLSLLR